MTVNEFPVYLGTGFSAQLNLAYFPKTEQQIRAKKNYENKHPLFIIIPYF